MNKQAIIDLLTQSYSSFTGYINGLTPEEYVFRYQQKWTAGQQLEHIVMCVKPLVQVFSMDQPAIEQNFGRTDRPGRSYEVLLTQYLEKLEEGGKAPERYVPQPDLTDQRAVLTETLAKMIKELCAQIENFTEQDLDSLCVPHPLLGSLTLREMLFNAIYHVEHHHKAAIRNLQHK